MTLRMKATSKIKMTSKINIKNEDNIKQSAQYIVAHAKNKKQSVKQIVVYV